MIHCTPFVLRHRVIPVETLYKSLARSLSASKDISPPSIKRDALLSTTASGRIFPNGALEGCTRAKHSSGWQHTGPSSNHLEIVARPHRVCFPNAASNWRAGSAKGMQG